ncbi:hypothetical protein ARMSODRAFT_523425 [Armillaria solidipes]|uniref:Uncharacterized protein n=1 Tax=Armillaria solidipes TaxID=1076256 RepID=A0A2H3BGL1_9AGAR|nr:hypothetical protein ARMSODRAFT_523425 [Armillaria solidipes]
MYAGKRVLISLLTSSHPGHQKPLKAHVFLSQNLDVSGTRLIQSISALYFRLPVFKHHSSTNAPLSPCYAQIYFVVTVSRFFLSICDSVVSDSHSNDDDGKMTLFQWLARLFYTIFYFTTLPEYSNNPTNDMYIFPQEPARSATSATCVLDNIQFLLRGLGTIHVERVEYRKSRSAGEHEYLVVTTRESSGAWRRGYLLVDRLDDNPLHRTSNRSKRWDPPSGLDRLVILCNPNEARNVQGRCAYDVLMTMDLPRSVTLEDFLVLVRTTSSNAPRRRATSQSYRFAYTIWKVLEMETGAHVNRTSYAVRQGYRSGKNLAVGGGETPEKVKLLWEEAKVVVGQEFDASLKVLRAPVIDLAEVLRQEQAASQQDIANFERERAGRLRAEDELKELQARLARLESELPDVSTNA